MGKSKNDGVQNRHLYTRVSYLHQAACRLATLGHDRPDRTKNEQGSKENDDSVTQNMARLLVEDLRAVSRKVLIRPTPAMKRTMCKICDTVLVEGRTCFTTVENHSKGGRKPWADVMAMRCTVCGHIKRFPANCPRQKRRPFRVPGEEPPTLDDADRTEKG
ncbi:Rpr2-domain-containing protein [Sodiomyces alkalinus F11]|uniref:Rpr2-domain-containing protein n=1 Tax=Sodiomyces alkalinus (strain CBS 110278 / VKM F-3762 / F11) TaxID=1314773 RepID=A0A3N2PSN0_SODAK|nr:Rpr2-domain-containing protein [Sodiomyces alkalinus F11]ROT37529.1 Rpr2-domain-containing protein [Sodiomyces alkalinus F11]